MKDRIKRISDIQKAAEAFTLELQEGTFHGVLTEFEQGVLKGIIRKLIVNGNNIGKSVVRDGDAHIV